MTITADYAAKSSKTGWDFNAPPAIDSSGNTGLQGAVGPKVMQGPCGIAG